MAATETKDRLHARLDVLMLKTLSWGPRHGYAIAR
jgi:PadR family transcriptional regulator, regulatory protein PadR